MTPKERDVTDRVLGVPLDPPKISKIVFWGSVAVIVGAVLVTWAHSLGWLDK